MISRMPVNTNYKKDSAYLRLGTSSFTADGWEKTFYPKGMQARDYLSYYATQFDTLEIDATFYRIPAESTVKGWNAKTPANFLFALKAPQEITHERVLVDTEPILQEFLRVTDHLGEKRGPILFQFQYFNNRIIHFTKERRECINAPEAVATT
jgi:uncharacterized protein YecE (DUF72 family)